MRVKADIEFMIWHTIRMHKRLEQRNRRLKHFYRILRKQQRKFEHILAEEMSKAIERAIMKGLPLAEEE